MSTKLNIKNGPIHNPEHDSDGFILEKTEIKKPRKYKVILHNDDYTTMEFVIFILQKVFHKTMGEAEKIMLEVHQKGRGLCGVYTYEIAETKSKKVEVLAKENHYPLLCTVEPE